MKKTPRRKDKGKNQLKKCHGKGRRTKERRKRQKKKGKQAQGEKFKNKDKREVTKKQPSISESPQKEKTTCIVCLEDYDEDWI